MKDLPDRSELVADPAPVAGGYTALRVRVTLGTELAAGERLAVFCPYPSPAEAGSAKAGVAGGLRRTGGALPAGSSIEVVFGDRSKGSPGARASVQALGQLHVACYRLRGEERHVPRLPACPVVEVSAGPAVLVRGFATPVLGRGEKGRLKLTAEDRLGNRARDFAGSVRLLGVEGLEGLPAEMRFAPADAGCKELDFTAAAEGVHHPVVSALGTDLEAGPVEVGARAPEYRLFFGELHCHTEHSYDAFGTLDEFYDHARRTAALDFAAAGWTISGKPYRHLAHDEASTVVIANRGVSVLSTGLAVPDWRDYVVSAKLQVCLANAAGIVARYGGLQRYLALVFRWLRRRAGGRLRPVRRTRRRRDRALRRSGQRTVHGRGHRATGVTSSRTCDKRPGGTEGGRPQASINGLLSQKCA
jgi:hypothetical protein